jgi:hypothetical protein
VIQISKDKNGTDAATSKELTKRFSHPDKKNLAVLVLNGHNNIETSAAASILLESIKATKGPAKSISIMTKLDNQDGYVDKAKADRACKAIKGEHGVPNMPPIYVR